MKCFGCFINWQTLCLNCIYSAVISFWADFALNLDAGNFQPMSKLLLFLNESWHFAFSLTFVLDVASITKWSLS
jgi:hypothetical protein